VKPRDKDCELDCKDLKVSTCKIKKVSLWISLPVFGCGRARINQNLTHPSLMMIHLLNYKSGITRFSNLRLLYFLFTRLELEVLLLILMGLLLAWTFLMEGN
jgi:hypothetical protein